MWSQIFNSVKYSRPIGKTGIFVSVFTHIWPHLNFIPKLANFVIFGSLNFPFNIEKHTTKIPRKKVQTVWGSSLRPNSKIFFPWFDRGRSLGFPSRINEISIFWSSSEWAFWASLSYSYWSKKYTVSVQWQEYSKNSF